MRRANLSGVQRVKRCRATVRPGVRVAVDGAGPVAQLLVCQSESPLSMQQVWRWPRPLGTPRYASNSLARGCRDMLSQSLISASNDHDLLQGRLVASGISGSDRERVLSARQAKRQR